jgi:hypothetical protein
MKQLILIFFSIATVININAQDIDLYKKDKNDNYNLPSINQQMTYDEFELLAEHMRMKDMMYAVAVPGYIHFKAKENKKGYWLVGTRIVAYLTAGAVYLSANSKYENLQFKNLLYDKKDIHTDLLYGSIVVALATYGYDLIHGDYILHKKQEKIRYKYAIMAGKHPTSFNEDSLYPSLAFTIQF